MKGKIKTSLIGAMCLLLMGMAMVVTVQAQMPPVRTMPSEVSPGECFNVTTNFTAPTGILFAFLQDEAPEGWNITVISSEPPANYSLAVGNLTSFTWNISYPAGTNFSVVYNVCVPSDASPRTYSFAGSLTYWAGFPPTPVTVPILNNETTVTVPAVVAVPTLTPFGIAALIGLLSVIAAKSINMKKRRG